MKNPRSPTPERPGGRDAASHTTLPAAWPTFLAFGRRAHLSGFIEMSTTMAAPPLAVFEGACPKRRRRVEARTAAGPLMIADKIRKPGHGVSLQLEVFCARSISPTVTTSYID